MKVEGKKSTLPGSIRQPSHAQAEKGTKVCETATGRRRHSSISNATHTQDKQPLKDKSNLVSARQEISRKGAKLCNKSVKGLHEDLFNTLGIAFCDDNRMNLFANTLIKEIQTQVVAALSKHTGISVSAATKTKSINGDASTSKRGVSFMPLLY